MLNLDQLAKVAFVFDGHGQVVHANPAASTRFGNDLSAAPYGELSVIAHSLKSGTASELQRLVHVGNTPFVQSFTWDPNSDLGCCLALDISLWHKDEQGFPDLNPNPVIEFNLNGGIRYQNPAARATFIGIETETFGHAVFHGLEWSRLLNPEGSGASLLHDGQFNDRNYLIAISRPESLDLIRIYAIDVTDKTRVEYELEESKIEVIYRLARAAELRDDETGDHVVRMSEYTAILARMLGWTTDEVDAIRRASTLHDIGKIGVPDAILQKDSTLTEEEFEVIKTHTVLGGKLLSGTRDPVLQMAQRIALTHHERWDGRGYPNGLKGEEIPIEGRICAVADVFDALTTERRYKAAWTVDESIEEIRRNSGVQFDPAVVNALIDGIEEILAAKELLQRIPTNLKPRQVA